MRGDDMEGSAERFGRAAYLIFDTVKGACQSPTCYSSGLELPAAGFSELGVVFTVSWITRKYLRTGSSGLAAAVSSPSTAVSVSVHSADQVDVKTKLRPRLEEAWKCCADEVTH
ncbi:hypothetical protein GUITHDRAFT_120397 [Guillardia theta CCMP2712]|uniref:Uncharacterized protein n=1 Tax=Guillardia theta (strain CCMP2712) TaxID=905079 RepID=L1IB01_GUITC|nr:hypothetical protein GUITHDRAFT_120397 [Guillardia theta CCMP2712]EKX33393.1 hypothetical protein GUITHDRAFT_120397 [Guillardia theta CCMP2712]|eukprot:XP_005820373.1 hypothetical protein GUITHDRAFT_120397 [Guillardia theta CCMP2712]